MSGYPTLCEVCGQRRTCNDAGECHECEQRARDEDDNQDERFATETAEFE